MFDPKPTARADLKAGTLYAVAGEGDWIYYGQVTPEKAIGFFRQRDKEPSKPIAVLAAPIMAVISVGYPSITRAIRSGRWQKLGRFPVVAGLIAPRPSVQWPVGALTVSVCISNHPPYDTRVEDPAIQDMERMAVWDAEAHLPARLTADFEAEVAEWHIGGPIWRERRVMEEIARRCPDQPWHSPPEDWVRTEMPS
ncbi:hypothetical protein [uncultured Sphingomonas sp.]|uniref:hypothetical protein n=1 Tax=uncultured Sphingomonas sp. TaxID=158754 RepID=UPI0025D72F7C|nr:hypothetical protein [uncultured Sphingomonas sp.]